MNVKKLKEILDGLPEGMRVYLASDEEGNYINSLEDFTTDGYFFDDNGELLYEDTAEEIKLIQEEELAKVLTLWP